VDYNLLSDQLLVDRFVDGDNNSFEVLLHRHKNKIFSYIVMMVRKTQLAEDIYQDTLLKVIKSLQEGKYHDNGKFISWVMRIAHNLIIDHYRKEKQLPTVSNDNYDYPILNSKNLSDKNIEDSLVYEQICTDARNLLDYLPAEQREVVIMRLYGELSFKEIAEQTNVSLNTALGRMRYALLNLRKLIEEKNLSLHQ
jgi:RNA polymerase sigma-70 factor (ECF subfamily)